MHSRQWHWQLSKLCDSVISRLGSSRGARSGRLHSEFVRRALLCLSSASSTYLKLPPARARRRSSRSLRASSALGD
eukprot:scaffold114141_cov31-Tisochrysis_lutea.AAC.2